MQLHRTHQSHIPAHTCTHMHTEPHAHTPAHEVHTNAHSHTCTHRHTQMLVRSPLHTLLLHTELGCQILCPGLQFVDVLGISIRSRLHQTPEIIYSSHQQHDAGNMLPKSMSPLEVGISPRIPGSTLGSVSEPALGSTPGSSPWIPPPGSALLFPRNMPSVPGYWICPTESIPPWSLPAGSALHYLCPEDPSSGILRYICAHWICH